MIQNSRLVTWTYNRNEIGKVDKYLDGESNETLHYIKKCLKDDTILISNSINDVCNDIFENIEDVEDIDIIIRLIDDALHVALTTEGNTYNPFSNEKLMKSENIEKLSKLNCKFEFDEILGFNKSYIIYNRSK